MMVMMRLQKLCQTLFLALFLFLLFRGKIPIWMGIFLGSFFLALLLGRFYCGWICPINTAMEVITKIKHKLGLKNLPIPEFIKKPAVHFTVFALFIAAFLFSRISGQQLPVLPFLFLGGITLTLFFPASLWHRYLCPYAFLLALPSKVSLRHLQIDSASCRECGLCAKVCPGDALKKEHGLHIDKKLCLHCLNCIRRCPQKAVHY